MEPSGSRVAVWEKHARGCCPSSSSHAAPASAAAADASSSSGCSTIDTCDPSMAGLAPPSPTPPSSSICVAEERRMEGRDRGRARWERRGEKRREEERRGEKRREEGRRGEKRREEERRGEKRREEERRGEKRMRSHVACWVGLCESEDRRVRHVGGTVEISGDAWVGWTHHATSINSTLLIRTPLSPHLFLHLIATPTYTTPIPQLICPTGNPSQHTPHTPCPTGTHVLPGEVVDVQQLQVGEVARSTVAAEHHRHLLLARPAHRHHAVAVARTRRPLPCLATWHMGGRRRCVRCIEAAPSHGRHVQPPQVVQVPPLATALTHAASLSSPISPLLPPPPLHAFPPRTPILTITALLIPTATEHQHSLSPLHRTPSCFLLHPLAPWKPNNRCCVALPGRGVRSSKRARLMPRAGLHGTHPPALCAPAAAVHVRVAATALPCGPHRPLAPFPVTSVPHHTAA
ncbi:unnamed protein product [Closterium sp. NIES-54]